MLTDLEIASSAKILEIGEIAKKVNITNDELECFGKYKAKINLKSDVNKNGKVILVTAINPTPAGEGKSTVTIGLADALNRLNKNAMVAMREPSLGPVMGVKGGACGGGYAQVIPMEDINLHFTGDIHAITAANNLISAMLDNHIFQGNELNINPENVIWHRALDMNDRALRTVNVGLGGKKNGIPREDHFDITVASEVMAVLCLAKDAADFKERISRMVVAYTYDNKPVTVEDIKATGAVMLLMKEALKPNLVQTLEHTPALVHGGPFANIAHGCNSAIATKTAIRLADYVVTEAGFGADLGAEKFLDIKCQSAGITPSCVVVVATIRALKMHGGVALEDLKGENVEALANGLVNLEKHLENIKKYNLSYVVAINRFYSDTEAEIEYLQNWAKEHGHEISLTEVFAKGGLGGVDLAAKVVAQIESGKSNYQPLYNDSMTVLEKIEKICKEIYGAKGVELSEKALAQLELIKENGWNNLKVCIAKTQYSLSDNAKALGRPTDFIVKIRELKPSVGAGFIVALAGNVLTMPGLPKVPAANNIDVIDGKVVGLF